MQTTMLDFFNRPKHFHNTIGLKEPDLTQANKRASHQEEVICDFFCERKGYTFTPDEVAAKFPQWPITSIRRAITGLTKRGKLRKTQIKRVGPYGVRRILGRRYEM